MKRYILAVLVLLSFSFGTAQTFPPCSGGCDAEYPVNYDVREMWATYGYPMYIEGCWWYDGREIDGVWWYMCPPDYNLYAYYE